MAAIHVKPKTFNEAVQRVREKERCSLGTAVKIAAKHYDTLYEKRPRVGEFRGSDDRRR